MIKIACELKLIFVHFILRQLHVPDAHMCTCVDFNTVEQQICGKSGLGCRAAGHHTGGSKVGHGLLGRRPAFSKT